MAYSILPYYFTISLLIFFSTIIFVAAADHQISASEQDHHHYTFLQSTDSNSHKFKIRKEKLSHFRFYWHDILSGKYPTSVTVVRPLNTSTANAFGMINMIDNPLTLGPNLSSKSVGKAQGFYASASQEELGFLMTMNFAFTEGKYNGSTISIMGRNPALNAVREMPVVGGSGLFRFARGYAQASTHSINFRTGDACVEYNVYVMHY